MLSSPILSRWATLEHREDLALAVAGRGESFRSLTARARGVARALLAGRLSLSGARVGLLLEPGPELVEALLGTWFAGGCVVVLSPGHPLPELAYLCEDAGLDTLVVGRGREGIAQELTGPWRTLRPKEATLGDDAGAADASAPRLEVAPDAPALQLYTSGTTGKPKGVVLSHLNIATQQSLLIEAWGFTREDVLLHALPLHHMHGLVIALLTALGAGATTLMLPSFDPLHAWERLSEATVFMGVPTMYAKLLEAYARADDVTRARWRRAARGLRLAISGSAALPVRTGRAWEELAGRYPLERFGMTEVGVALSNPLDGDRRAGTVGRPLPTFSVRIVGEDGVTAATGGEGELQLAGPSVFSHYHRRAAETSAAFVLDEGRRWFRTGDTARLETEGYVRILGRTSVDILKSGGYKLSALEVEEVLRAHPAVADVAVVGVPDETWGERVVACVTPRPGMEEQCSTAELRSFVKGVLPPYKAPREVRCVDPLPRNALGKVMKRELVRLLEET